MESTVTATDLARKLGDVLARVRYRGDTFIVEKNGVPVARVVPIEPAKRATLAEALAVWMSGEPDPEFADLLESIGAADLPPDNPWES